MESIIPVITLFLGLVLGYFLKKFILQQNVVPKSQFDESEQARVTIQSKHDELLSEKSALSAKLELMSAEAQNYREQSIRLEKDKESAQEQQNQFKSIEQTNLEERKSLQEKIALLNTQAFESGNQVTLLAEEKRSLSEKITEQKETISFLKEKQIQLEQQLDNSRTDITNNKEKIATLESERDSLEERISQHKQDLEKMEEKFKIQFENLANKIFDEKAVKFKTQSQESLGIILNPLKEKLADFQKKVDDSFGGHAKEQFALKEEIKRIVEINEKMTFQTEGLTKALKGDVKTQGAWGEIILERILEDSGLRKGIDYILQGANLNLKHVEEGTAQKPDVIVNLPDGKHVIIDSKVSLTHYERYSSEDDEISRAGHLKQFISSVRTHVNGLEQRRYQDADKLGSPDFVLMFMPIEGAYSLAVQKDPTLHAYAWNKKIVIVCPTTLFATLKTIASVWKYELQHQNALEIAKKGGSLYDKISAFVSDMQKLGLQISTVEKTYGAAMNKLSDGKGNIIRQAEQLRELGVRTSKSLPKASKEEDDEENIDTPKQLFDSAETVEMPDLDESE